MIKKQKSTISSIKKEKSGKEKIDTSWRPRFLDLLSKTCNVTLSAKGAGIDRSTAYKYKRKHADFAEKWEDCEAQAVELLEAEAWKRAREKSDLLLIFLLKAHRPEKYRETQEHRVTGGDGGAIELVLTNSLDKIYGSDGG